tara:strand:- start:890 stop:1804 length:915 start_codon:yes stop_codon:yes gene_type:complete
MDTIIVSIDTKLIQDKESISSFKYNLPFKLKNVVEINLSSIEVPNSIYVFTKKKDNDYMLLKIFDKTFRFYLPNGNYDIKELYDNLLEFFNTIESYNFHNNKYVIIGIAFDVDIARFKINCNVPFSLYFDNSTKYQSLGRLIGFAKEKYEDVMVLVSELIPDIIGDKYIFMRMNDFGNLYHNNNKYFSKIIINKETYEMVFNSAHKFITKLFKFNQPTDIETLNFTFEDYLGNLIEFNGIDLSFTLEFKLIKNEMLNKFYSKFNYDHELMKLILHDSMLKYYTNSLEFNNKELAKKYNDIINSS